MARIAPVPHPKPNAPIAPTMTIHKYSLITAIAWEERRKRDCVCWAGSLTNQGDEDWEPIVLIVRLGTLRHTHIYVMLCYVMLCSMYVCGRLRR